MTAILDDLRSSARLVRRSPGTVALALLSLTLGIGANAAVFSFVNAVQFRPLPVADEATLVDVSETSATELCAGCGVGTSYPTYLDWKQTTTSFAAILMSSLAGVALLMASMGTFEVIAYSVSQRTRESGVRVALSATPQQVPGRLRLSTATVDRRLPTVRAPPYVVRCADSSSSAP
jgi:hypothetical protein